MGLKLYFYSNRNIVGTCAGILAAGLAAIGVIHEFWPVIVAGAYGAGALLTPANRGMNLAYAREMNDREIIAELERIASTTKTTLPPAIASDVGEICSLLIVALPIVARLQQLGSPVAFDVRTTATEYLPQTLDRYLKMPKVFRATVRDRSGQTPTKMLGEQIGLLKGKLTEMVSDLAAADMDKIAANGLFLKDKFATPEFAHIFRP